MNSSLQFADRGTHIKIVMVAVIASLVVVLIGTNARMFAASGGVDQAQADAITIKASKSATYTDSGTFRVR
jgi:hypothetical protein